MIKSIVNRLNGSERLRFYLENEGARVGGALERIGATLVETQGQIARFESQIARLEVRLQEMIDPRGHERIESRLLAHAVRQLAGPPARLLTAYPTADSSDDFKSPRGTANDNTYCPRFVDRVESRFRKKINFLDLGCAGGGLVVDFIVRGHRAIGVEGSDYSQRRGRAAWGLVPSNLFTADITKPFSIEESNGDPIRFEVVTAWEVLEHLPESLLAGFAENVRRHLTVDGIFVGSVATFEDKDEESGAVWHQTVKPREWWIEKLREYGFALIGDHEFETADFVRGSGNPTAHDWNAATNPELGFHVVARPI
jgi:2-polyprenyl-3-methyl-5-hydroxy-6-metoxy-1,4-benzoquinol methylase